MIYIQDTAAPVRIYIPRTTGGEPAAPALTLTGTVSRRAHAVPLDDVAIEGAYYAGNADFSGINEPGEYLYRLTDSGEILATGLAVLGMVPASAPVQYDKTIHYEQYERQ